EEGRVIFDGPTADGLLFYHRVMGTPDDPGLSIRRPVDRQLQVTEVQLLAADGRRRELFEPGEPVRIIVALAAREPRPEDIADPEVVLEVRDESGRQLFRTTMVPPPALRDGSIVFEMPRLGLLGGEYDIAAGTCV